MTHLSDSDPTNVTAFVPRQAPHRFSPLRQAEAYWRALADTAAIPRRTQIDPRGLRNILGHTFVIERIAPGMARFRLAGHTVGQLAGYELRGVPLSCLFTPSARRRMSPILRQLFDTPAVTELSLAVDPPLPQGAAEARMLLLPLRGDADQVNRALGVLVADTPAAERPVRFKVNRVTTRPVPLAPPPPAPRPTANPARVLRLVT